MKKLALLIPTIDGREQVLSRLLNILNSQINNDVEIIIEKDDCSITRGYKRQLMIDRCNSKYLAFIDDDDLVSKDYVQKILFAIESNPDCCSLQGELSYNGFYVATFIHSIDYDEWFEIGDMHYRCPNHLNTIKTEIVKQVGYNKELHVGEDRDFSSRARDLLKNEVKIDGTIYYYLK